MTINEMIEKVALIVTTDENYIPLEYHNYLVQYAASKYLEETK